MNAPARWAVILVVSSTFALLVTAFSQWPAFAPVPPGHAELRISMAHRAKRREQCRQLTEEERQALPPTRRVTEVCERGRAHTHLKVMLNDQVLVDETVRPSGLHRDGRAYYQSFMPLVAGDHLLRLTLQDGEPDGEPTLELHHHVTLSPGDALLLAIGDGGAQLRHGRSASEDPS